MQFTNGLKLMIFLLGGPPPPIPFLKSAPPHKMSGYATGEFLSISGPDV